MKSITEAPATALAHRRWKFSGTALLASLVILAGVLLFLYPHAAAWFSQKEQSRVTETAQETLQTPPNDDALHRAKLIEQAKIYNRELESGALLEANSHVPTGDGKAAQGSEAYENILDITDNGFMGRLQYDALDIDLPIYHGTTDEVLEKGVGHLKGTSLPVGGIGTRSVLTAHRGLPEATLFNELDRAKKGDTFTVSVLDQTLTYRVVETQVIQPEDTQAIIPDPDRDLVTLVTCTPLGINTHRILVTAERITPTPPEDIEAAQKAPVIPGFPWWAVILGGSVVGLGIYNWRAGIRRPITR